ncbi:MAG: 30S ribosome-binding factor RbfA [Phycisphaerales bacterium]
MKRRTEQVASTLQRLLQERLARGLADPRVRGLITVTRVELSDDLSRARVKVTVLPESQESLTMHGLRSAGPKIRRDVGERLHLKVLPELVFEVDEGIKEQAKVMALLEKDRAEREAREAARAPSDPPATDMTADTEVQA